jgi:cyanophycinase
MLTEPGVGLIGGGSDCTPAFEWQIQHANGGDFIILRTTGTDAYNQWVMEVSIAANAKLNSVTTILLKNRDASFDSKVLEYIGNAEAIFFAGGDQSLDVQRWANTPLAALISSKSQSITISGTSAGMAILGGLSIYDARVNSAYSDESMLNPYSRYITFSDPFLKLSTYLDSVITDTHFNTRDRMGRYLSFIARQMVASSAAVHGVACDEETGVLLDISTGLATVVGKSNAYMCSSATKPEICEEGKPLTFNGVQCTRLSATEGDQYDFSKWSAVRGGVTYNVSIEAGHYAAGVNKYGP